MTSGGMGYDAFLKSMVLEGEKVETHITFKDSDVREQEEPGHPTLSGLSKHGGRVYVTNMRLIIMTANPVGNMEENDPRDDGQGFTKIFTASMSDELSFWSIPLACFLPGLQFTAGSVAKSKATTHRPHFFRTYLCGCCCCCDTSTKVEFGQVYLEPAHMHEEKILEFPMISPPWGTKAILKIQIPVFDESGPITNKKVAEFVAKFQDVAVAAGAPMMEVTGIKEPVKLGRKGIF